MYLWGREGRNVGNVCASYGPNKCSRPRTRDSHMGKGIGIAVEFFRELSRHPETCPRCQIARVPLFLLLLLFFFFIEIEAELQSSLKRLTCFGFPSSSSLFSFLSLFVELVKCGAKFCRKVRRSIFIELNIHTHTQHQTVKFRRKIRRSIFIKLNTRARAHTHTHTTPDFSR